MSSKRRNYDSFDAWLAGLTAALLGLVPAGCLEVADAEGDQVTTGAQMLLDPMGAGEMQTASVCSTAGTYQCFAHIRATPAGRAQAFALPAGFGATDLQAAYRIPQVSSGTPTIAIVVAYGYPQLEADLAVYRNQYGLPACTVANGCLTIVNQNGATSPLPPPPPDTDDWTLETALDLDMASAACPKCKLLVVQADDNLGNGLLVGQRAAAQRDATVISNSWGGPEQPGQSLVQLEKSFDQPGIAIFVSTGDNGYNDAGRGPDYPATSAHVIGVGGTSLVKDGSARGFSETAWANGGSACSLSIPKPAYQTDTGCNFKATADIAAVGNPQTGVSVYNAKNGGWLVLGGTSASSPLVAGIFAATGNGARASGAFIKANAAKLYDVTSGNNGTCPSPILCNAGVGWDGPTGYGTPNGSALVFDPFVSDGLLGTDRDVVGGCAAAGGQPSFATGLVLVLGALLRLRRRSETRSDSAQRAASPRLPRRQTGSRRGVRRRQTAPLGRSRRIWPSGR